MTRTTDQEERKKIYAQIQQLLHEEVPVIFIYWEKAFPALAKNIGGFWPSAFNYLLWNANSGISPSGLIVASGAR